MLLSLTALIVLSGASAPADPIIDHTRPPEQRSEEKTIFVTGSLIPKRIRLRPIANTTVSPLRVINRREIDGSGRFTTLGAFINEPSVHVEGR